MAKVVCQKNRDNPKLSDLNGQSDPKKCLIVYGVSKIDSIVPVAIVER